MSDDTERLNWGHVARSHQDVLSEAPPEYIPIIGNKDAGLLWAKGAPLFIGGSEGTGKTVLLLQYIRAVLHRELWLDRFPVTPLSSNERLMILNMDRPEPLKIRLAQILEEVDLSLIPNKIKMLQMSEMQGKNLVNDPTLLKDICAETGTTHLLIDGLDRLVTDITADQGGRAIADGMTHALSGGFHVMGTMHLVKSRDNAPANNRSRDLYGSQYLGASAGAIVILNKESETHSTFNQRKNIAGHDSFTGRLEHDHNAHRSVFLGELSVIEAMQLLGEFTIKDLEAKTAKARSTVTDHMKSISHLYKEIPTTEKQTGSGRISQRFRWTGSPLTEQSRTPLEPINEINHGAITANNNSFAGIGKSY